MGSPVNEGLNSCATHAAESSCERETHTSLKRLIGEGRHVVYDLELLQVSKNLTNSFLGGSEGYYDVKLEVGEVYFNVFCLSGTC